MKKTTVLLSVVGTVFLIGMTGCVTTSGIEASGKVTNTNGQTELNKSIAVNNRALARDIELIDMKSTFVGNILKAQVSLRSKNRDTVPIQYRFKWMDAQGFEINSNNAWKPFLLYGKETRSIQGVAPDQRAKEFILQIRDPDAADPSNSN